MSWRPSLNDYLSRPLWYQQQQQAGVAMPTGIAYFSMEFGVAEVLPNYSGGLGILAGDHLKSASDLGVPLIAVGLYYRSGYFRQSLTADGWQQETYPSLDPQGLPLRLLTDAAGDPVLVELALPDSAQLRARIWVAQVGRVPLLLLDSDVPENEHDLRSVTDRLYGGDQEHRILQEILAGIGGVRAIRAFTAVEGLPAPEVFHMNEGHAGFLGVERIRELITDSGLDFDTALTVVRSSTVFTTHTPVPAGIDRFPVDMVERYFDDDASTGVVPTLLPGVPTRPDHRARRRGRSDQIQHGPHGSAAGAAGQRCLVAARPGEPGHVQRAVARDSTPARCRSGRSPTASMRAPGRRRSGCSWVANWPGRTRSAIPASGCDCSRSTPATCGGSARSCARCWSRTSGCGCASRGWNAGPRRPNWAGSQRHSIPTC